ncbi:MAG: YgjP-like metallopeptidase domain-containing protein, partial [Verrucomicrobiota bacterium]
ARDSNLGSRSARRSTQRSIAEWSAEPEAKAGLIVPEHYSDEQINGLLARKSKWIESKQQFFSRLTPVKHRLNPNELRLFGQTFLYVNTPPLRFRADLDYRNRIVRTGINLVDGECRHRWYRRFAKRYLRERAIEIARIHGFSFHLIYVRAKWKRWGKRFDAQRRGTLVS